MLGNRDKKPLRTYIDRSPVGEERHATSTISSGFRREEVSERGSRLGIDRIWCSVRGLISGKDFSAGFFNKRYSRAATRLSLHLASNRWAHSESNPMDLSEASWSQRASRHYHFLAFGGLVASISITSISVTPFSMQWGATGFRLPISVKVHFIDSWRSVAWPVRGLVGDSRVL
jgi:hypothetical protein